MRFNATELSIIFIKHKWSVFLHECFVLVRQCRVLCVNINVCKDLAYIKLRGVLLSSAYTYLN